MKRKEFWQNANVFITSNAPFAEELFSGSEVNFDHISFQTTSAEEYKNYLELIKDDIEIIEEIAHTGRRITIGTIKTPLIVHKWSIDRIEICEPKPKRTALKNSFDHLAFYAENDFDKIIHQLKTEKLKLEFKQFGEDKLVKVKSNDFSIEIRSKRLGSLRSETQPVKSQKDEFDYEKILNEEKEKKLRALADYQNLLKRYQEEKNHDKLAADSKILRKILDVLDDFQRFFNNTKLSEDEKSGIYLIYNKLVNVTKESGMIEIECKEGDHFDPEIHEAVGVISVDDPKKDNSISEKVLDGYKLASSGEVIRAVKVIVAKVN